MTFDERLIMLRNRIPSDEELNLSKDELTSLLESAKFYILSTQYPFPDMKKPDDVEKGYHQLQVEIALRLYNKIGAEGEIAHSESGISRTYGSVTGLDDLLSYIVPYAGVL